MSITDTAPVPATRTEAGEPRKPRKPRSGALLTLLAWVVGVLFVLPVVWMVLPRCTARRTPPPTRRRCSRR